jgi:hypothetical protein
MLMPPSLRRREGEPDTDPERLDLKTTLEEFEKLGILSLSSESIALSPKALRQFPDRERIEADLPIIVSDHAFCRPDGQPDRLMKAMAWYLSLPVTKVPGTWDEFDARRYPEAKQTGLSNSVPYAQLRHWGRYLGLIWVCSSRGQAFAVPDPTAQIRWRLPSLRGALGTEWLSIRSFMAALVKLVPVLDGGSIRSRVTADDMWRAQSLLSTSTSLALRRLEDEHRIELTVNADADLVLLDEETKKVKVSHIRLLSDAGVE